MPRSAVTEGERALGQLLQAYGEVAESARPGNIAANRRDRLRAELEGSGASVSAGVASVLADAMASGRLAVTDMYLFLSNDGGLGVRASCSCKSGRGGCQKVIQFGRVQCVAPYGSTCKSCEWTLGLTIANAANRAASTPEQLGVQFVQQLPDAVTGAIAELAALIYPIVDRLSLREQREAVAPAQGLLQQQREPTSVTQHRLVSRLAFPLLSLADAIDKLFSTIVEQPYAVTNQLRLAVGNYPSWVTRKLANALGTGAIAVDGKTRSLTVNLKRKRPSNDFDVACYCVWGTGACDIQFSPTVLSCAQTCEGVCFMQIKIPSLSLDGLDAQFESE